MVGFRIIKNEFGDYNDSMLSWQIATLTLPTGARISRAVTLHLNSLIDRKLSLYGYTILSKKTYKRKVEYRVMIGYILGSNKPTRKPPRKSKS